MILPVSAAIDTMQTGTRVCLLHQVRFLCLLEGQKQYTHISERLLRIQGSSQLTTWQSLKVLLDCLTTEIHKKPSRSTDNSELEFQCTYTSPLMVPGLSDLTRTVHRAQATDNMAHSACLPHGPPLP